MESVWGGGAIRDINPQVCGFGNEELDEIVRPRSFCDLPKVTQGVGGRAGVVLTTRCGSFLCTSQLPGIWLFQGEGPWRAPALRWEPPGTRASGGQVVFWKAHSQGGGRRQGLHPAAWGGQALSVPCHTERVPMACLKSSSQPFRDKQPAVPGSGREESKGRRSCVPHASLPGWLAQ